MTDVGRRDLLRLAGMAATASVWPEAALARDMTHRERIEAALKGESTDRAPFGFWWHFANRDRSPRRLAELAVALQRRLDLDFIKFSPYGLYSVVDWGVTLEMFAGNLNPPVQTGFPIQSPDDWLALEPHSGEDGEYLVLLEAQRIALDMLDGKVPFTQTIFSPLTSAAKMVGRDKLPDPHPAASRRAPPGIEDHHRNDAPLRDLGRAARRRRLVLCKPGRRPELHHTGRARGVRQALRFAGCSRRPAAKRGSTSSIST